MEPVQPLGSGLTSVAIRMAAPLWPPNAISGAAGLILASSSFAGEDGLPIPTPPSGLAHKLVEGLQWPSLAGTAHYYIAFQKGLHGNLFLSTSKQQGSLCLLSHSSNVLLDQNFTPKLAHSMAHPCPVNRTSKYTMMKTHLFQASTAYLPEDFIRVGQLTKRVDIFSCGIVRASFCAQIKACTHLSFPWLLCKHKLEMFHKVQQELANYGPQVRTGLWPIFYGL